MINNVKNMILENNLCVLSTCNNDLPNSSLMQYICNENCTKIYVITLKDSTKYQNIERNPRVSLLIDTRDSISSKTEPIKSLTVYGKAEAIEDYESFKNILNMIVKKHKNLTQISENVNCMVIEIRAEKFLLLDGVNESRYMEI